MGDIAMPRLSDSMEEGTILRWLKSDGDDVKRGEELVEIETDKANMTYQADAEGVLEIVAQAGATLAVGERIARLGAAGQSRTEPSGEQPESDLPQGAGAEPTREPSQGAAAEPDGAPPQGDAAEPARAEPEGESAQAAAADPGVTSAQDGAPAPDGNGRREQRPQPATAPAPAAAGDDNGDGRVKASPVARRMARERGIELARLHGTGPGGRIVKADVEAAAPSEGTRGEAPAESFATGAADVAAGAPTAGTSEASAAGAAEASPAGAANTSPSGTAAAPPAGTAAAPPAGTAAAPPAGTAAAPPAGTATALESGPARSATEGVPPAVVSGAEDEQGRGETEIQDPTRLQRTVARRMAESKATAPDFVLTVEVDMGAAVDLRAQLEAAAGDTPTPSFNDFVVKASALALRDFPRANGAYRDGHFERYSRVNVGVAVAGLGALAVPTVFDADRKSLGQVARETRALAERVRAGKITPPELSGGTFTVSNLGMYGIRRFVAVINPPQAAILAVGELVPRAVVRGGEVQVRHVMELTLSCDHRILYGADAAQFLACIRTYLEQPLRLAL